MAEFWEIIVKSNTFNFAILLLIFAVIIVKINFPKVIEELKNSVANSINNANSEKENSEKNLKNAKKIAKNTDNEINEKLTNAKTNAETIANRIESDTKKQIEQIFTNVTKVSMAEEKTLTAQLTNETVDKAVELAQQIICDKLKSDKNFHEKFINDSIDEINRMNLCK